MKTYFDDVDDVYIPAPNRPQPVFLPHRLTSNEVFMIQHSEQLVDEQKLVWFLSPSLHSRLVPCHLRFSLPEERPLALK